MNSAARKALEDIASFGFFFNREKGLELFGAKKGDIIAFSDGSELEFDHNLGHWIVNEGY